MLSKLFDLMDNLKPWQLLAIAGSATLILFAGLYFTLSWLTAPKESELPAPPPEMRSVVVAKTDIAPRTTIRKEMLTTKEFTADSIPEGAALHYADVVGQVSQSPIHSGDVISQQKLLTNKSQLGFIGTIPKDCRAISISVNDITGVSGFAKAGDYVDVILVEKDTKQAKSTLILQNVLLLSINKQSMNMPEAAPQEANKQPGGISSTSAAASGAPVPSVATLALVPDDALHLTAAAQLGELYLMLRPFHPGNTYVLSTEYTARSSKLPSSSELQERPAAQQPQAIPHQAPAPVTAAPSAPAAEAPESMGGGFQIIQGDKVVAQ